MPRGVNTGAYVTVARPYIVAGWLEKNPNQRYTLQTVSAEALHILKEVFLTPTPGLSLLKVLVFVTNITNEFSAMFTFTWLRKLLAGPVAPQGSVALLPQFT
jgi:hypothetical protein